MATKAKQAEKAEVLERLREWIKPGDTVYTILRHVSASGMSRDISVVIFRDGRPLHPNYAIAKALGRRLVTSKGYDAIRISGAGMDMGFEIVYSLSCRLFCPDVYDHDAAYSLRQEWL